MISYLATVILSLSTLQGTSAYRVQWKIPAKVFAAGMVVYGAGRLLLGFFSSMNIPLFIGSFCLLMVLYAGICLLLNITTIGELRLIATRIIRMFLRKESRSLRVPPGANRG